MNEIGDAIWTAIAICIAAVAAVYFALRQRNPTRVMWKGLGVHVVIAPCEKCGDSLHWTTNRRRSSDAPENRTEG